VSGPDRLPRLLALVPYLLARPGVPVADAAADFGITPAQLRRDLNLLWVCGLPGHGPGDLIDLSFEGDTITVLYDAGMSRPLRLREDEALALVVALRTLADVPGLAERDALDRALAKLENAAGEAAKASAAVAVRVEAEERTLPVVRAALEAGRQLRLTYYVATRDETTRRDVDPMRLLLVEGRSYLEAWCRRAEGVRLFRLDRIDAMEVLDVPAEPPASAQPRDVAGGVFAPGPGQSLVTLSLSPGARWVADYYPCESVQEDGAGGLVVSLRVADPGWARRLVLGLGGAARVVEPASLATEVRAAAHEALAAYGSGDTAPG